MVNLEEPLNRKNSVPTNTQREGSGVLGATTLFGRLGQALKSDAYGDLGSSALARVLVVVGG